MENENITNMIKSASGKDAAGFNNAFKSAVTEKLINAISERKKQVASRVFGDE